MDVATTVSTCNRTTPRHFPEVDDPRKPVVQVRPTPKWKRAMDILGALFVAMILAPLLILLALFIKVVSRGPVIFSQHRLGSGAQPFVIHKFRTMTMDLPQESHADYVARLAASNEPVKKPSYESRLIPGGALLRKLSLDELPQLRNVLLGNMSLIGPRPDVLNLAQYQPWQLRRFEVLPGITGLWQVSGKNDLTFDEMVHLDIEYIDTMSFWGDLKILFKTLPLILLQDNE